MEIINRYFLFFALVVYGGSNMRMPENEYKYIQDLVEIRILLKDGTDYFLIAEGDSGVYGVKMNIFYLYDGNEKIGREGLKKRCFSFAMPESDIEAEVKGGMLIFKRFNNIIFMERRDYIKDIIVGTEGNWINLCKEQRELFEKKLGI